MANLYTLVLTSDLLPSTDPDKVWSSLASVLRIEEKELHEKMARAPFIIKQDTNLGLIQSLWSEIIRVGVRCEICSPEEEPLMLVEWDGMTRGPIPHSLLVDRLENGTWPTDVPVAIVGTNDWKPLAQIDFEAAITAQDTTEPVSPTTAQVSPTTAPKTQYNPLTTTPSQPMSALIPLVPNAPQALTQLSVLQNDATPSLPIVDQPQTPPVPQDYYAGFWKRLGAALIDVGVVFLPIVLVIWIPVIGALAIILGLWLYNALLESSSKQGTLGKMAMSIKVVDLNGNRISFGRATGRHFSKILSNIIFYIGFMMAGWTQKKQGLHDMIASTLVINKPMLPKYSD